MRTGSAIEDVESEEISEKSDDIFGDTFAEEDDDFLLDLTVDMDKEQQKQMKQEEKKTHFEQKLDNMLVDDEPKTGFLMNNEQLKEQLKSDFNVTEEPIKKEGFLMNSE